MRRRTHGRGGCGWSRLNARSVCRVNRSFKRMQVRRINHASYRLFRGPGERALALRDVEIAIDVSSQNRLLSIHGLPLDSLRCRHHHGDHLHRRVVWRLRTLEAGSCGKPPKAPPETDGAFGVSGPPIGPPFAASINSIGNVKTNGASS
jgi:hypothetical protein